LGAALPELLLCLTRDSDLLNAAPKRTGRETRWFHMEKWWFYMDKWWFYMENKVLYGKMMVSHGKMWMLPGKNVFFSLFFEETCGF